MTTTRTRLATALCASLALTVTGCAQTGSSSSEGGGDFPTKPIELIVGYDAGGPTDTGARLLATELEDKLDATITVVNEPAANSQVAYTTVAQAEPDGYTMGTINFPSAIITTLDESRQASYTREDFAPVALQVVDPTALAVPADSPIDTPQDLVEAALADPGALQATTSGVGSNEHFALARLQEVADAEIAPIHFADGSTAATTAFLGGNADILLANVGDMLPLLKAGQVKVVGVMAQERSPFLEDVPTFEEAGYEVDISSSRGLAFPSGTPDEIIEQVSTATGEIMADPAFEEKMTAQGLAPNYLDAEAYAQYWDETEQVFSELLPLVQEGRS
ncbi:MAG: tripartite tricarboxylate transporter substrate binding protein [Ornithinimicrobium sp.]